MKLFSNVWLKLQPCVGTLDGREFWIPGKVKRTNQIDPKSKDETEIQIDNPKDLCFLIMVNFIFWICTIVLIPKTKYRFFPTTKNRTKWRVEKEIRDSIKMLIEKNNKRKENLKNLLSLFISANKNQDGEGGGLGVEDVIDECKTFYFAGNNS